MLGGKPCWSSAQFDELAISWDLLVSAGDSLRVWLMSAHVLVGVRLAV